jgi:hypothetical protein
VAVAVIVVVSAVVGICSSVAATGRLGKAVNQASCAWQSVIQ